MEYGFRVNVGQYHCWVELFLHLILEKGRAGAEERVVVGFRGAGHGRAIRPDVYCFFGRVFGHFLVAFVTTFFYLGYFCGDVSLLGFGAKSFHVVLYACVVRVHVAY